MIELSHLTKRYGMTFAVEDLTATINPAQVTGLIGPNEAGKTTTLRMILGLTTPTWGTATTGGHRYVDLPHPMRQVGALLEPRAIDGRRRAHDHLLCVARSNRIPRGRVDEVLLLAGLEDVADRRVRELSLGMCRRLGIAMTMLGDPEVLIYDDPTGGLDPAGIAWVRGLLRRLADEGRTVLVTSHLMSEIARMADHVLVIGHGRLIVDGDTADLARAYGERRVLVRCDRPGLLAGCLGAAGACARLGTGDTVVVSGMDAAQIYRLSMACGVHLSELTPERFSLEEVFLELTGVTGRAA